MEAAAPLPTDVRLEDLEASFDRASETVGGVLAADYLIGGLSVSFRFAGPALHDALTPAFAHLATAASQPRAPRLTVNLWDSTSAGSAPPPRPPDTRGHARGTVYHFHEPPLRFDRHDSVELVDRSHGCAPAA